MSTKTIYKLSTGDIVKIISAPDKNMDKQLSKYDPSEYGFIGGKPQDPRNSRVIDGEFVRQKDLEDSRNMEDFRITRRNLLASTDWTQTPDSPVDKAAWARYRKELRDLPEKIKDPSNIPWPVPPT